jgi:hypothetical protein
MKKDDDDDQGMAGALADAVLANRRLVRENNVLISPQYADWRLVRPACRVE